MTEEDQICVIHGLQEEYVIDPFMADVHNEEVWMWLCPECEQERRDDI